MNNADTAIDYQYSYDKASNVTSRTNNINGTNVVYTVDNLDRITQRKINLPGETFSRISLTFSAAGPIMSNTSEFRSAGF